MGELTFFLRLQVQQKKDGIIVSQDKYVADILKKFDFATVKTASTPMEPNKALIKDEEADSVDVHLYRSMIGSLMYLTTSRPDIIFSICTCASDYAGASLERKSTTGGSQFLGNRLISWQCKNQTIVANSTTKAEYVAAANCCGQTVYKEWEDRMERAVTTASSLDAEQDNGNINRTQSMATLNESFPQGTDSGSGPRFGKQKEKRDVFWQTASTSTLEDGEVEITATIDSQLKTITEASLRRHLKLEDADGISSLPNTEIFEQLALMGYASDSDKLTFQKGHFSPQWRFLIHTILHCLSPKKTAWEQFSSNIATAIICLATNRTFNFSKMIFEGMVKNLDSSDEGSLTLNELTVLYTTLSKKMEDFQNDLKHTKLTYGAAYTKLILRVKKLEHKMEGTSWIQEDAEIQTRNSADTEVLLEEPTELVEDLDSGEKSEKEVSTAGVSTAEAELSTIIPEVSTAAENLVYIRRSAEKRKDKGKVIMKEDESVNEEERQRIARDAEIAKQLQAEIDTARQEQEKSDLEKALELQKQLDEREEVVAEADPA
ncbi:putative ribonuclease H-like domain-containing protein [Tanacetum coccineum]